MKISLKSLLLALLVAFASTLAMAQTDADAIKRELAAVNKEIAATNAKVKKAKGAAKKNLQNQLKSLQQQKADLENTLKSASSAGGGAKKKTAEADLEVVKVYPYDSIDYQVKSGYNPLSVIPLHISDVMLRTKITRKLDFKEKCNTPFDNKGAQFWKYVLEAYRLGQLDAFVDDSLNKVKNPKFVLEKLMNVERDENGKITDQSPKSYSDFRICTLKEDLLFDRQRSQTYYDIQAVGLWLPATDAGNLDKVDIPIAYFRYKDIERVLNNNPLAKWKNQYNTIEDRRFSDAFRLRLFCGRIVKFSRDNAMDEEIGAHPNFRNMSPKQQLIVSQQFDYDLVSQENELYEY